MFSYAVGLLACLLVLYTPLSQLLFGQSPSTAPRIRRTPRPAINESLLALDDWTGNLTCGEDQYSVHLFSKEPLIIYIESFLTKKERAHLLDIRYGDDSIWSSVDVSGHVTILHNDTARHWLTSSPSESAFEPATITHNGGAATQRDQTIRDSEVAVIPRDEVVRCIEARARAFQGWRGEQWIERLRTQRYRPGGHYNHHFDWSSSYGGWGRVTSFMAWVDGSPEDKDSPLLGGGTEFPLVTKMNSHESWCRFIDCDSKDEAVNPHRSESDGQIAAPAREGGAATGVVFKPLAGNAVYWENFRPDGTGRGWDETWHAGLPVIEGIKVGLNIWTWGRID